MQRGNIFKKGGNWYLRFYRDEVENGQVVRRRTCQKLAPFCDTYRTLKSVRPLAEEILSPLNSGRLRPESTQTVSQFIEAAYLPYVREHKRASTAKGYEEIVRNHLRERLAGFRLRDFRTADGERMLSVIAHEAALSHRTLLHIKSFIGGVFTYAKRIGALDGINPMRDVSVPRGAASRETKAYSFEEVRIMLRLLPEPAKTLVATAAFTGLRASELRGLRWDDFSGDEVRVERSIWRRFVNEPKTQASASSVPVVPLLARMLTDHRKRFGGTYMFESVRGRPIDIHTLGSKVIRSALHGSGVEWNGWHAFRRGLATNLHRLGVAPRTIQAILRHSNVSTTLAFYVKTTSADSVAAMELLEKEMGNQWATTKAEPVQ